MFSFRTVFFLFLVIPIIEIYLLIQVGSVIGGLPTVGLVVLTAVIGAWMFRRQGFATLAKVQETLARGEIPAVEMIEGAMLLVGGALLLTPGFFTDAIGFVCLVPALRRPLVNWFIQKGLVQAGAYGGGNSSTRRSNGTHTIEGECWRDDER